MSQLELAHAYGDNIHILNDPYLNLGLSDLCSPQCGHPALNYWITRLYSSLLHTAVRHRFARKQIERETRMKAYHPEGVVKAEVLDPNSKIVVASLARAGILPSHTCYDELNRFFKPDNIRQDHILLSRQVDAQEKVIGTAVGASKIGGGIADVHLLIPDPMGATGSTVLRTLEEYAGKGTPKSVMALHLIVTPEYIRKIQSSSHKIDVFAIRLDRGLSTKRALDALPGQLWDEEKGLNAKDYIVPGGGGLVPVSV